MEVIINFYYKIDLSTDCEIRRLAYEFSKKLIPARGENIDVFEGLEVIILSEIAEFTL